MLGTAIGAQQLPFTSLYNQNWYDINPAYGGMDRFLKVNAMYRSQWTNLNGYPESYRLNAHMPFYAIYGAAGLHFNSETIGPRDVVEVGISYNYVQSFDFGLISIGVRPYLTSWTLNGDQLRTSSGVYEEPTIDHNDPLLADGGLAASKFNLDVGIHFQNKFLKAGLLARQLVPNTFSINQQQIYPSNLEYGVYGEYFYTYNSNIDFVASGLLMTDFLNMQTALNIGTKIADKYNMIIGMRGYSGSSFDAIMLGGGIKLSDQFWLHYNYDIGVSGLRNAHRGSHELLISYTLGKQLGGIRPPRIIYNPRYVE